MRNVLLLLTLLFVTLLGYSQTKMKSDFTFNHLALAVKDLNRSAEFYMQVFQLPEITNRTANPGIRWISMGDGSELHLISNADPVTLTKTIHLAFSTANLEAFQKRLAELKISYGDWGGKANAVTTRADGVKQIYLQDPDGYWIEINNAK